MRQVLLRNVAALGTSAGVSSLDGTGTLLNSFFGLNQIPWPLPGTFRNLFTHLEAVPGTGDTRTFALRVNGVNSALTTTHGASDQTQTDEANLVAVSTGSSPAGAGDLVQLHSDVSGTPAVSGLQWAVEFESDDDYSSAYGTNVGTATSGFADLVTGRTSATAADCRRLIPCPGTISTLMGVSTLNNVGGGVSLTVYLYKNGVKQDGTGGTVDTALVITGVNVGVTVTKTFSLPVVRGDDVYVGLEVSGAYNTWTGLSMVFEATAPGESIVASIAGSDPSDSVAHYARIFGNGSGTGLWSSSSSAFTNALRCGVSQVTLSDLLVEADTDPGSGKTRTFELLNGGSVPGDTPQATLSSGVLTAGGTHRAVFTQGTTVGPMRHTPASTPAVTGREWWSLVMGATDIPPGGGGGVTDVVVTPAVSDIGTAVKRVFLRLTIGTGSPYTELAYAETTLTDDPAWYGGKKSARLLSITSIVRELSDSFRGTEVRVVLADDETRPLRASAAAGGLAHAVAEIFVVDDDTRYAEGEPHRLFNGIVHKHDALPGFQYELVLRDVLSDLIATLDDAPRMPPGVLNEPEFPGIRGAFENRAIPLVIGHCDDSTELVGSASAVTTPQGVVPPLILGVVNFQTAFGGIDQDAIACIWSQCALAANGIWEVYFNTPDNPYVRVQVPFSSFGVDVWTPGMPGWADVGVADDYIDYPSASAETRRYTPFFVNLNGPYSQPFLDGQILVAGNLYGVAESADGTGAYLSDAPRIWQWLLVNFLYSEYRTGDFAAIPTFANGHSIINVASVATATARLQAFDATSSPGTYPVGVVLGADGKQQTLRHVLDELCRGVLMEQGIDRHGRLMVDVEDVDAVAAVSLSDLFDIEVDSFTTWIDRDGYRNYVEYVFGFRYVPPTAPIKTPTSGEALPTQPVSPYSEWTSGLRVVKSDDAIAANRGINKKVFIENRVVRSEAVATSVATRALHRGIGASPGYEGPRMWKLTTSWQGLYKNGVDMELGTVVALDHLEGIGASGWTNRRGRVLKISVDPLNARVTLEGRILYAAGAGES